MGIRETSRIDYWGGKKKPEDPEFRYFEVYSLDATYQTKFQLHTVVDRTTVSKVKAELKRNGHRYIRAVPSTEDNSSRAIYVVANSEGVKIQ